MPLKPSSLSFACAAIRSFLMGRMTGVPADITIKIGSPGEASATDGNIINLFFYRFDPSGFGPVSRPGEPLRIKIFCLVSAFGVDFENVSGGENELRMLGEVMRVFHETPILAAEEFILEGDTEGEVFRAEVLYHPLTEEQVSQFWNVSGDQGFRPSVAYEFSLIPIVPEKRLVQPPRVGALGAESHGQMSNRYAAPNVSAKGPNVLASHVDIQNPFWEPKLAWVVDGDELGLSQSISKTQAASFSPEVWLIGDTAEAVELVWETWRPDEGWQELDSATSSANPFSESMNPEDIPPASASFPEALSLPAIFADVDSSQAMLYARRTLSLADGSTRVVRSNPLLISIFDAS
ncbi:MAG: Pvc16 family protein [Akkermansiaceae bacterium]